MKNDYFCCMWNSLFYNSKAVLAYVHKLTEIRKMLLFIGILIFFTGCIKHDFVETKMTVFRYNEAANITSLDPAYAKDQANIWATHQIFNGLVQLDNQLKILPCIAKSWEINDGGREYVFHLRGDVYYHDHPSFKFGKGRKVVAKDFIYSFNRIIDKKTASPGRWVFSNITRVHDTCMLFASDDSTFIIHLNQPFPPFLGLLSTVYCSVVPEEAILFYGQDFRKNPVGTGPFRFKMWKEGVKLVLLKNPGYFEMEGCHRLPYLDAVAVTFLSDKQSAFLEFMKGRLDFLSGLDISYKDELLTYNGLLNPKYTGKITLLSQPYLNTEYFGFLMETTKNNIMHDPVKAKKIRQAINYAFDRHKMVEFLRNNIGKAGTGGIVPYGLPSFDSNVVFYDYQPLLAKQLLKEAGYVPGSSPLQITLSATSDYLDISKYIQHELEQIGINMKIEIVPPAALKEMKSQAKAQFFRASWIADYPDAENYLSLFYSKNFCPNGPNYTHFASKAFDQLYEKSLGTVNDTIRYLLYKQMEKLIMQEAPVVILYYDQVLRFVHNNVQGLESDPMNMLTLKRVRKS